ncbi:hypothetical protein [Breoghania sp.]|uniref:hypothetical protein n=1 Tax=Breoghania sp. TaxID=2065378 RepID=UPI002AABE53B|nr:hypothetical protein [Breoghania sp.]
MFWPDIAIGNLITIGGLIIGQIRQWAVGWEKFDSTLEDHARRLAALEIAKRDRQLDRVRQVQLLTELRSDLKYLRAAVERMEAERGR